MFEWNQAYFAITLHNAQYKFFVNVKKKFILCVNAVVFTTSVSFLVLGKFSGQLLSLPFNQNLVER